MRRKAIKRTHGVQGLRLVTDLEREARGEPMHFFERKPKDTPEPAPEPRPTMDGVEVGRIHHVGRS